MTTQGSPEWLAERLGKVTASRIVDVMATVKSGEASGRANYRAQLVAERLTGTVQESFTNGAMQWGTDNEPIARAMYEVATGTMVDQVGFVEHPSIYQTGASPDGMVDDDGLVEIKCPNTSTHIETLLSGKAPSKYIRQMQWQMDCCGRQWCDFVSYDPRMPSDLSLFVIRVHRDQEAINEIRAAVVAFLDEVDSTMEKLGQIVPRYKSIAGAMPAVQPAVTNNTGSASQGLSLSPGDCAAPDPAPTAIAVAPVAVSVIDTRATVVEHQDEIAAFMASRDFRADSGRVRAILVEFVKFQATRKAA